MTTVNPLLRVKALGQSLWLDYIQRALLDTGGFARLIAEDGISGVTSNPAIFEQAITTHHDYDAAIAALARDGADTGTIYEALALEDVRHAADQLRAVYDRSHARDGYVSLEVSPRLAHDTAATVAEAQRLWSLLDRPNVMIKVPATRAGLPAVTELIAASVNINVTLLFGLERYREAADAWLTGLERRAAAGLALDRVASVASFFLSRIDTLVDKRLDQSGAEAPRALRGRAAIACARLAYQHYKNVIDSGRWRTLARAEARPQRLLWASTSTKDPAYSDTKYVDALIGPDTVNTLPPQTLAAYRDHGDPAMRLEQGLEAARALPEALQMHGIDLAEVSARLEREGVEKFAEAFEALQAALARQRSQTKESGHVHTG